MNPSAFNPDAPFNPSPEQLEALCKTHPEFNGWRLGDALPLDLDNYEANLLVRSACWPQKPPRKPLDERTHLLPPEAQEYRRACKNLRQTRHTRRQAVLRHFPDVNEEELERHFRLVQKARLRFDQARAAWFKRRDEIQAAYDAYKAQSDFASDPHLFRTEIPGADTTSTADNTDTTASSNNSDNTAENDSALKARTELIAEHRHNSEANPYSRDIADLEPFFYWT